MEEYYVDILNVFIMYYNKLHNTHYNMFNGIDKYEDTTAMMEEFYEHMYEYNSQPELRELYSLDDERLEMNDDVYGLKQDDNIICVSGLLLPIFQYIIENIDWKNKEVNWNIISGKLQ